MGIMRPLHRRQCLRLAVAAVALPVALRSAWSQVYPARPVRIIVPFPAGGSSDVGTRIVAEHLSQSFGRQFFIENKSGAGGNIGIEAAARAAPDGYTLLAIGPDVAASALHDFKLGVDPLKDLAPVIQLSRQPVVLAVHPSLGVTSVAELVAVATQTPGLNYALGGGEGRLQHLVIEWFAKLAGIQLVRVPYRGGAPAINDLLAGHVKIGSLGLTPVIPHYQAGTLRLLAQSTAARSSSLPQVPTYQEAGIQGLILDQWLGLFAPTGTPPAITSQLNAGSNRALTDAAVQESLLKQAQEPVGGTAQQFLQLFRDDYSKFERLIRELNIKVD
jgi:tripartite-type tricarboxylate transporter receptor subunit TctC